MSVYLKICLLLFLAPLIYLATPFLFNVERKFGFYSLLVVHSLITTFALISVLNLPVTVLSDEVSFLNKKPVSEAQKKKADDFLKSNFLLIDNAFDKELIANPAGNKDDSTYIVITNRRKLTYLCSVLADDINDIDLVVCDIGFDDATSDDTLLKNALTRLYSQDKLLVSVAGKYSDNTELRFPVAVSGDVKEETNEKLFVTHRLKRPNFFSLPYLINVRLQKIKTSSSDYFNLFLKQTDSSQHLSYTMNTFLPQFFITDESLLKSDFSKQPQNNLSTSDTDFVPISSLLYRTLGNAVSKDGEEELLADIQQRRRDNKKNIIFLGSFSGNEDLHRTAYTELHGPTIILNLVYALGKGENKISVGLICWLFIWCMGITLLLFNGVLKKVNDSGAIIYPYIHKHQIQLSKCMHFNKFTWRSNPCILFIKFIFIEESQYWLLLILVAATYVIYGILLNGISLAVYLIAFETFAIHFGREYNKSRILK